jgi:drug/metabolite transporter (DMT)-like permease
LKNVKIQEYLADFSLIITALIWGSTFIIVKKSVDTFEPISFVFLRFMVASIFMLILTIPLYKKMNRQLFKDGVILGSVLFIVFLFQTIALKLSTATEVGFLTGLYVLFVPILSAIFLKKYPHMFSWIGVVLSALGMMMITFQAGVGLSVGQLFAIINAFFIGVHILVTDIYSRKHNVVLLTMMQIVVVCVLSGVYSSLFENMNIQMAFDPYIGYSIIFTGIVATVLCFFLQTAALIILAILIAEAGTALKHSKKKS